MTDSIPDPFRERVPLLAAVAAAASALVTLGCGFALGGLLVLAWTGSPADAVGYVPLLALPLAIAFGFSLVRSPQRRNWTWLHGTVAAGSVLVATLGLLVVSHWGWFVPKPDPPEPFLRIHEYRDRGYRLLPVGSVAPFASRSGTGERDPLEGWLVCDGRELDGAAFPELALLLSRGAASQPDGRAAAVRLPQLSAMGLRGRGLPAQPPYQLAGIYSCTLDPGASGHSIVWMVRAK